MTRNMLDAVDAGEFADAAWVSRLLHHFAGYYFGALDAYEAGEEGTPEVWRCAHDAARRSNTPAISLLLLGVNAHINYDLVLAVADLLEPEWPCLSNAKRRARYEDYCRVNDIIGRTIDRVQDGILEKREPIMALIDTLFGPMDEWLVSRGSPSGARTCGGMRFSGWRPQAKPSARFYGRRLRHPPCAGRGCSTCDGLTGSKVRSTQRPLRSARPQRSGRDFHPVCGETHPCN